jgi:hypothetical protein
LVSVFKKPKYDEPLSNFTFIFNLRHYSEEDLRSGVDAEGNAAAQDCQDVGNKACKNCSCGKAEMEAEADANGVTLPKEVGSDG